MRQDANNTRQARSMSRAYQKFRVYRHLDLRVLATAARVPHIGSGRSVFELSPDHGRAYQVESHVRDKVSLPCSGRALADLPMSTKLVFSLTLVHDERVGEEALNCSDARL